MLNEALKYIRKFHNLTQSELSNKIGKNTSYISEVESGKRPVTMDLLNLYADSFGIPPSSLLLFSEQIEKNKPGEKVRVFAAKKIIEILNWIDR